MGEKDYADGAEPSSEPYEGALETTRAETESFAEDGKESRSRALPDPIFIRKPRARILILTDDGIDFGDRGFGLSLLVDTLAGTDYVYLSYDVTTASRNIRDDWSL